MEITEIKSALYSIGKTYPTLLGLMKKPIGDNGNTVGNHWAGLLKDCNAEHFRDVCWELANLKREPPEMMDRLPFAIVAEVQRRVDREQAALEHHTERIRHRLVSAGNDDARNWCAEKLAAHWLERDETDE